MRALVLALLALALAAPAAQAHATLESTAPQRGATVHAQPRRVVFGFNEPVEGTFGAVRVFDARARRVDDNHVSHPGGVAAKAVAGSEEPAPQVSVTAAQPEGGAPAASGGSTARTQPATQPADSSDKASKGPGIVALALGGLGFALGAAALVVAGRRRSAAAA